MIWYELTAREAAASPRMCAVRSIELSDARYGTVRVLSRSAVERRLSRKSQCVRRRRVDRRKCGRALPQGYAHDLASSLSSTISIVCLLARPNASYLCGGAAARLRNAKYTRSDWTDTLQRLCEYDNEAVKNASVRQVGGRFFSSASNVGDLAFPAIRGEPLCKASCGTVRS
ncbi:hypothetical protein EVAR_99801_1 [Eumeta japonica]|uniref:Uncharacterized protein n=1 Tax=Eumeta variegata TaxID=151549 RepID=A0A4C1ZFI6_EUMVA|nr:hypothetical protein EVAR_99801_1 [Eumeta japonica]